MIIDTQLHRISQTFWRRWSHKVSALRGIRPSLSRQLAPARPVHLDAVHFRARGLFMSHQSQCLGAIQADRLCNLGLASHLPRTISLLPDVQLPKLYKVILQILHCSACTPHVHAHPAQPTTICTALCSQIRVDAVVLLLPALHRPRPVHPRSIVNFLPGTSTSTTSSWWLTCR